MKNFRTIWTCGMPRSGTSWLCQIFESSPEVAFRLAPLFSYQFRNTMSLNDTAGAWRDFFLKVYNTADEWILQLDRRNRGDFPVFEHRAETPSHLVIKDIRHHNYARYLLTLDIDFQIVHIVRNPLAAMHSWVTSGEFPEGAMPREEWNDGKCRKINENEFWGLQDWIKLTRDYLRLQDEMPDKVYVVSYEELVNDPITQTTRMFEFAGLDMHDQTIDFLTQSHSRHDNAHYSVFKNKSVVTRWKDEIDPVIEEGIRREMRGTGLEHYMDK